MIIRYDRNFLKKLKKVDVRIRKRFKERLVLFIQNPLNPQLNNHSLQREYQGYRSIDITNDWRALYEEKLGGQEVVVFFVALGTHDELYGWG